MGKLIDLFGSKKTTFVNVFLVITICKFIAAPGVKFAKFFAT